MGFILGNASYFHEDQHDAFAIFCLSCDHYYNIKETCYKQKAAFAFNYANDIVRVVSYLRPPECSTGR